MVKRHGAAALSVGLAAIGGSALAVLAGPAAPAFADSQAFEVYCPGTPVGSIVLNDAKATGTITPASVSSGQQFNLTGYQATVTIPQTIANAAASLGNPNLQGSATISVDATGATPATIAGQPISFNQPIPSPVPPSGVSLSLPAQPATVGPFTATGGTVTVTLDPSVSISVTVSGSSLALTCKTYPNNAAPTGITTSAPPGQPAAPVIATATAGAATPTTQPPATQPAATPTTQPPSTSASGGSSPALATTGAGPHLWFLLTVGVGVLLAGLMGLGLIEGPRHFLRRALRTAGAASDGVSGATRTRRGDGLPSPGSTGADAGEANGLWLDGWEPGGRSSG
jgi:hypothetical protein